MNLLLGHRKNYNYCYIRVCTYLNLPFNNFEKYRYLERLMNPIKILSDYFSFVNVTPIENENVSDQFEYKISFCSRWILVKFSYRQI